MNYPHYDTSSSPELEAWMTRNRARRAVKVIRDRLDATRRNKALRILVDRQQLANLLEQVEAR